MSNIRDYNTAFVGFRGTEGLHIAKEERLTKKNSMRGDVRDYFDSEDAASVQTLTLITNLNAYGEAIANLEETNLFQFEAHLSAWVKCVHLAQNMANKSSPNNINTLSAALENATNLLKNQDEASFVALQHSIASLNHMAVNHENNGRNYDNTAATFVMVLIAELLIVLPFLPLFLLSPLGVGLLITLGVSALTYEAFILINTIFSNQESKQVDLLTEAATSLDKATPLYLTDAQVAEMNNQPSSVNLPRSSSTGLGFFASPTSDPAPQIPSLQIEKTLGLSLN